MFAAAVRVQLQALGNSARAATMRRYFKTGAGEYGDGDRFRGIPVPALRMLSRTHKDLALGQVLRLLSSPWHEDRLVALLILVRQYAHAAPRRRQAIYRLYLRRRARINNWDLVDCSAEHIVGAHVRDAGRSVLRRLAASKRVWDRRIAIMATFHYIKRGKYGETVKLARLLLADRHDLIHKAVGWMLREIGKRDRVVEERFLRRYGSQMPRTMLHYAIERFPSRLRRRYLEQFR